MFTAVFCCHGDNAGVFDLPPHVFKCPPRVLQCACLGWRTCENLAQSAPIPMQWPLQRPGNVWCIVSCTRSRETLLFHAAHSSVKRACAPVPLHCADTRSRQALFAARRRARPHFGRLRPPPERARSRSGPRTWNIRRRRSPSPSLPFLAAPLEREHSLRTQPCLGGCLSSVCVDVDFPSRCCCCPSLPSPPALSPVQVSLVQLQPSRRHFAALARSEAVSISTSFPSLNVMSVS